MVLAAVKSDGRALRHAPEELRADREVALAAVNSSWKAMKFVAPELQTNREIVQAAAEGPGSRRDHHHK